MRNPFGQRRARSTLAILSLLLAAPALAAQTGTIVGRVIDQRSQQPITAASVQVEGSRLGGATNENGQYRITNVPIGQQVVAVRRIGYGSQKQTVTTAVGRDVTADFALTGGAIALDQIVVTGTAGAQELRSVGNAVSTIDASDAMEKSQVSDISSLLKGRAPGVAVLERSGRLGSGPTIEIRGRSSIGLENSPLIYIDGIRVNNATASGPVGVPGGLGGQGSAFAGRLNDIQPDDIESIQIIKGPAAATIYGTEAANGVVQIITKKGAAASRTEFAFQIQEGSLSFRDAENRMPTNFMRDKTSGAIVPWNGVQTEAARGTPLFKTGMTRQYNGSVSGARDLIRYYLASSFENDYGIEPNNSLRQASVHANVDVAINPKTDFSSSLNFVNLSSHLGADVGLSAMFGAEFGHPLLFPTPAGRGFYSNFPPDIPQKLYDNADGINRFTASGTLNNRLTSWFTQRAIVGIDYTGEDARAIEHFAPPDLAAVLPAAFAGGRIGQTLRHNSIITADYSGTAKVKLGSSVMSSTSVGGQFYNTELNSSFLGSTGFPAPGVETVTSGTTVAPTQTETINTTIGGYAEQQFAWRDRLFVAAGLRVDNNSAFGNDFKWVTYPKVSASWVVSEEPFWHWGGAINALRVRAAYGESGRQPTAFSALRAYNAVPGPGGVITVTPGSAGNADLRPEHGKEIEAGFEAGVGSRLTLNFTYYNKHTIDEIVSQNIAPSSGFPGAKLVNLGEVANHGIELDGSFRAVDRRNLSWSITGSLGTAKDEIKKNIPTAVLNGGQFNVVGYPIGGIFLRRVVSADRDATTKLATNILCDGGAGKPSTACASAPFVYIGTPTPTMTGSVGNTFTIGRRLTLYGLVDFRRGNRIQNAVEQLRCTGGVGAPLCEANYFPEKYSPIYLAETATTAPSQFILDQYWQDGGFAKLRELSASYLIPERFTAGASRASLTLAARELRTWTKYRGIDPEVNSNNPATSASTTDQALIPPLMRLIATLNVKW
ncbi:MAG TPA: SusC/RagA family TonB-linked outer membrane protein [Gemmatimonadaceae bacterium]|nr:SusC/RagA family TonB-linked outer membrane protein [Gemmatimonadaceae bacterium]